jgi:hypothetical protein
MRRSFTPLLTAVAYFVLALGAGLYVESAEVAHMHQNPFGSSYKYLARLMER